MFRSEEAFNFSVPVIMETPAHRQFHSLIGDTPTMCRNGIIGMPGWNGWHRAGPTINPLLNHFHPHQLMANPSLLPIQSYHLHRSTSPTPFNELRYSQAPPLPTSTPTLPHVLSRALSRVARDASKPFRASGCSRRNSKLALLEFGRDCTLPNRFRTSLSSDRTTRRKAARENER